LTRRCHTDIAKNQYDATGLTDWLTCPMKFKYAHVDRIEPAKKPPALVAGELVHEALAVWYANGDIDEALAVIPDEVAELKDDNKRNPERLREILRNYFILHQTDQQKWEIFGRIDMVVKQSGAIYVVEHKTTTQLGDQWHKNWTPNFQVDTYCYAAKRLYGSCQGVFVNGILLAKTKTTFQRVLVSRNDEDLRMWEDEYYLITSLIRQQIASGEKWWRNTISCSYYGGCVYRELCLYGEVALTSEYYNTLGR